MIIWQLFFLSSNDNLATIFLKPKYYLRNYFTKPKILFWQKQLLYTQNPNAILAHAYKTQILFLTLAKSLTHGKYNYSSLQKYLSYKIYKSSCGSPMAKLLIL